MNKPCARCKAEKPLSDFYRDSRRKDGYRPWCRACVLEDNKARDGEGRYRRQRHIYYLDHKDAYVQRARDYRKLRPGQEQERKMRYRYRLTREEYEALLTAADGRCAICRRPFDTTKNTHVDHDHVTGAVRGLLCYTCNAGLGLFGDSVELLQAAITYLSPFPARATTS